MAGPSPAMNEIGALKEIGALNEMVAKDRRYWASSSRSLHLQKISSEFRHAGAAASRSGRCSASEIFFREADQPIDAACLSPAGRAR
jgi:hypothetical protein